MRIRAVAYLPFQLAVIADQLIHQPSFVHPFPRPHTVLPGRVGWAWGMPAACAVEPAHTPASDSRAVAGFACAL